MIRSRHNYINGWQEYFCFSSEPPQKKCYYVMIYSRPRFESTEVRLFLVVAGRLCSTKQRTEISRKSNSANIFWSTESINVCIKFITKLNFGWKLLFVSSTYDQLLTSPTWHDALFLVVNVHSFSSIFGLYLLWTTTAFLKTQTFFAFTDSGPRGIKFLLSVNLNPSCCPAQSPVRKTSSRFISGVLSAHL